MLPCEKPNMSLFPTKPNSAYVKAYYKALKEFQENGYTTEGNIRSTFADLLKRCASPYDWRLVEEYQFKGTNKQPLRADGALVDELTLVHGLWEAKDTADDLKKEIKSKVAKGYPLNNILFQSPDRAILYQDSRIALDCDLSKPENLVEVLQLFFEHRQPHEVDWEEAVLKFSEKIPDLAEGATAILKAEYKKNSDFREKFQAFANLCRESINPDLTDEAIEKMLVQHLLTERIFRKVFNNPEFLSRNVIAAEIEKVIRSITAKHFSRDTFLQPLDRFYVAIEKAAEDQKDYTEKQHFLNAVYEKFFQRFDRKQADTHGIVYTPQPIVDFMVRSVEEVLKLEFGKSLSGSGVHILDPFTGTGNFITRIMRQIRRSRLPQKYAEELHCNEVMLLPYYIASMNIEHAYMEQTDQYATFEGICLVDTFDMRAQSSMFAEENTARIKRQRSAPIFVVIGNPPYNAWQESDSENNKNRRYLKDGGVDTRISDTYTKSSGATNKNALSDPYVKAFRWASDRIGTEGVIAFVSNSGFIDGIATDGMRKHLAREFDEIYIVDLGGNVRKNPKLSGTTHNVFGIQVGVSINILVRKEVPVEKRACTIRYSKTGEYLTRWDKESFLSEAGDIRGINWRILTPDTAANWLTSGLRTDFRELIAITEIFEKQSRGVATSRDAWVHNQDAEILRENVRRTIDFYNSELYRYEREGRPDDIDEFVRNDETQISWSRDLKQDLRRGRHGDFEDSKIRSSLYRPFTSSLMFFDRVFNEEVYLFPSFVPNQPAEMDNRLIALTGIGSEKPFMALAGRLIVDLHFVGPGCSSQCFPFYTYDEDGSNRREN